ncbi:MAG: hypothetical protein M9896_12770 [Candidatus Promineofilum sp.]|uniref:hypothetical protein n=1 Tax=Promineifilum sp. TaxID=2664178 RepID=UPI002411C1B4|nr:hypothetical protein [Promineifilum sp.]
MGGPRPAGRGGAPDRVRAGGWAKGTISRLKQQVTSTPVVQALEHCLQVGLIALVAQSTAAEPEQEVELASLFDGILS